MKVCDRCKKELDTKEKSMILGEEYELCTKCGQHIARHIRSFKGNKFNLFGG